MITPQIKDEVLKYLIEKAENGFEVINYDVCSKELLLKKEHFEMIVQQFHQRGYISTFKSISGGRHQFKMSADAYDLMHIGGFKAQEELLKLNLDKLKLEIEAIKKSCPTAFERITTILANISTTTTFMMGQM